MTPGIVLFRIVSYSQNVDILFNNSSRLIIAALKFRYQINKEYSNSSTQRAHDLINLINGSFNTVVKKSLMFSDAVKGFTSVVVLKTGEQKKINYNQLTNF